MKMEVIGKKLVLSFDNEEQLGELQDAIQSVRSKHNPPMRCAADALRKQPRTTLLDRIETALVLGLSALKSS